MRGLILLAALLPGAAIAQHEGHGEHRAAEPVCVKQATAPGFEGFGSATAGPLAIGKALTVSLRQETAPPPAAAGRPFKPGTYRGEAVGGLHVAEAGRYRIAVSAKAWLSVQKAGSEVESVAHGHGPACTGIAKIVSFDLGPGHYAVALSEAPSATAIVMVVKD